MVNLIDDLEDAGLVARKSNPAARRSYAMGITKKGKSLLERAMADARRVEN